MIPPSCLTHAGQEIKFAETEPRGNVGSENQVVNGRLSERSSAQLSSQNKRCLFLQGHLLDQGKKQF